jgi:Flp pilus assembly protein TadG
MLRKNRPRRARSRRREEGQALVEFALVLPVILLVLVGIVQFGLMFYTYIDLTSATRDAARRVAVSRSTGAGLTQARQVVADATTAVNSANATVTLTPGGPWQAGDDVTVRVTYPYSLDVMGLVVWSGPMRAESVTRIE